MTITITVTKQHIPSIQQTLTERFGAAFGITTLRHNLRFVRRCVKKEYSGNKVPVFTRVVKPLAAANTI